MANHNIDKEREPPTETWKSPEGFRFWTLIGIFILIIITGMNAYESHDRRMELNDQVEQLASAMGIKLANSDSPSEPAGLDPTKIYTVRTEGAPSLGPQTAPIRIAEFSDFQCGYCAGVGATLAQIRKIYKDEVQIVWKNLPLTSIHNNAMNAALASEAAYKQGKFWEFHDKLFENQDKLDVDSLKRYAGELGLNTTQFETDLQSSEVKNRVDKDMSEATSLGVTGTPTFFINGRSLVGSQTFSSFATVINAELQRLNIPVPPAAAPN